MITFEPLFKNPENRVICKKKQLTEFLDANIMRGEFRLFSCGELYNIKHKSKGLGYYQVWLEPTYPKTYNLQDHMMTETQARAWAAKVCRE